MGAKPSPKERKNIPLILQHVSGFLRRVAGDQVTGDRDQVRPVLLHTTESIPTARVVEVGGQGDFHFHFTGYTINRLFHDRSPQRRIHGSLKRIGPLTFTDHLFYTRSPYSLQVRFLEKMMVKTFQLCARHPAGQALSKKRITHPS